MSFDINKVVLWNNYKEALLAALDSAPAFEVDLAFEYKDNKGRVISLSSGDVFYITDIKFSQNGALCFEIPHGAETRFVKISYADSISNPELGELEHFLKNLYDKVFEDWSKVPDMPSTLFEFEKQVELEQVDSYNNSAEWIKETITREKDEKHFKTIDSFGMF